jgi:hypothetical protein
VIVNATEEYPITEFNEMIPPMVRAKETKATQTNPTLNVDNSLWLELTLFPKDNLSMDSSTQTNIAPPKGWKDAETQTLIEETLLRYAVSPLGFKASLLSKKQDFFDLS